MSSGGASAPVLSCRGVGKRFGGRVALEDVTLSVSEGERYGLVGPNGAGKTTLISIACGLLAADEGEVEVAGLPMPRARVEAARVIGFVPQDLALYADLTGRENLSFFASLAGLPRRARAARVRWALDVVGLGFRADDRVSRYSGGMKRRLNIAVGLLHEPRLLVLDEPTVGVDPQSRNAILETVAAMADDGIAVLYTSHYMEEVERLCERIGVLDEGRIVAEGAAHELSRGQEGDSFRLGLEGLLEGFEDELVLRCQAVAGVRGLQVERGALTVQLIDVHQALPAVFEAVASCGAHVRSVASGRAQVDLEAAFLELTGTVLRD